MTARWEHVDDVVRALVSINSANPATFPGGPGEREAARYCRDWLLRHGVAARLATPQALPGRPAVVAQTGSGAHPILLLVGHLDTYLWYEPSFCGDRVAGPGASDMKGGVAAILAVLARGVGRGTVRALLVPDEEHASVGLRSLLPGLAWDAAVVAEDSGMGLGAEHAGAVTAYAPVAESLALIAELAPEMARRLQVGSVTAQRDLLALRLTVPPGEDAAGLRALLPGDGWTVRESFRAAPSKLGDVLTASGIAEGLAMEPVTLDGWTEAGILAAAGRPCLVFGPGGGGAHTPQEWADLGEIRKAAGVLAAAARNYCEAGPGSEDTT